MIKVFIGTDPTQKLPTEVLKSSILNRTSSPVEFHELKDISLNLRLKMYTGFSFYRFCIPKFCQFKGKAIYLDADIVVLSDIALLFHQEMKGKGVLARPKEGPLKKGFFTSVMLMDCSCLEHWNVERWVTLINTQMLSYGGIMEGLVGSPNHVDFGELSKEWNHLDFFDETTKILHYTNVPKQPWKTPGHPFSFIFLKELKNALLQKKISRQEVEEEIQAGHLYPALLQDVDKIS